VSARRRVRAFLKAPSIHETPPPDELLARRWADNTTTTYDLRVSDVRALLEENAARNAEVRTLTELYRAEQQTSAVQSRKAAEATEKYRAAQTEAGVRGQRVDLLRTENATLRNTVAELSRKIQDPPGSHERWQSLRTSLQRAERERDEARAARKETDSYKEALEKALRVVRADLQAARDQRDNLLGTSDPNATEIRRLRAEVADLHKQNQDNELHLREVTASRAKAQALARNRESDLKRICAERDRLQEALNNLRESVRKGTPPNFLSAPGGLSAQELRKVAEDLLPQFLARLKDKL
jgi:chromosome segregation ATPase